MSARFARNTAYGSVAGCIATICSFASNLIIARELGVQYTGEVTFALWIATTTSVVVSLGLPFTMSRFLPDLEARTGPINATSVAALLLRRFLVGAFLPCLIAAGIAAYLSFFGKKISSLDSVWSPTLVMLVGACSAVLALAEFGRSFSRGLQRFDELAKVGFVSAIVQVIASVLLTKLFSIQGALLSCVIGAVIFLPLLRSLICAGPVVIDAPVRRMRRYAAFRWGSEMLALFVWSRVEVLFLQSYTGSTSVAFFATALTLSNLAIQGPMMLTWGLMPHFAERIALGDIKSTQRSYSMATRVIATLVLPACFGLAAIAHVLVPLLFGRAFAPASGVAEILAIAVAYPAIASVGSSLILATDRSDVDFYSCLIGTLISIGLGVTLTKAFGLYGAASSRIIVQTIVVLLTTGFLSIRLGLALPIRALSRLTAAAACCAAVAWIVIRASPTPGVLGVGSAILSGAASYALCLRYFGVFEPEELEVICRFAGRLPSSIPRAMASFIFGGGASAKHSIQKLNIQKPELQTEIND